MAGTLTPSVGVHAAVVALLVAMSVALVALATRGPRRSLRTPAIVGIVGTLVVAVTVGGYLSRPTEVNEQVETAPEPGQVDADPGRPTNELRATGTFESLAHDTRGTARVIERPVGGSVLTLQGFETDPGPDLFVYAVAGDPAGDGDVTDYVDLGRLKGARGDQQYELPDDFDVRRYRHVYIWCRAFTVGFGRAKLA